MKQVFVAVINLLPKRLATGSNLLRSDPPGTYVHELTAGGLPFSVGAPCTIADASGLTGVYTTGPYGDKRAVITVMQNGLISTINRTGCDLVQANNSIVRDLHGFHIFEVALLRTYEASLPCAAPTKDDLAVSPRSNFATEERAR